MGPGQLAAPRFHSSGVRWDLGSFLLQGSTAQARGGTWGAPYSKIPQLRWEVGPGELPAPRFHSSGVRWDLGSSLLQDSTAQVGGGTWAASCSKVPQLRCEVGPGELELPAPRFHSSGVRWDLGSFLLQGSEGSAALYSRAQEE